jgi:hypothetical protein
MEMFTLETCHRAEFAVVARVPNGRILEPFSNKSISVNCSLSVMGRIH